MVDKLCVKILLYDYMHNYTKFVIYGLLWVCLESNGYLYSQYSYWLYNSHGGFIVYGITNGFLVKKGGSCKSVAIKHKFSYYDVIIIYSTLIIDIYDVNRLPSIQYYLTACSRSF